MTRRLHAIAIAALTALHPALASAQPFGARLTHDGDPATSIAIGWNSASAADDRVFVGTSPESLDRIVPADETHTIAGDLGFTFTARLTGLAPGSVYYYRIGTTAGPSHPAAAEPPFRWRTLPSDPCAPFRVVFIGDNRSDFDGVGDNPIWGDILAEALEETPDLFVNTGDMVKNGDSAEEWAEFLEASEVALANVASLVTMGNHDEDSIDGDSAIYNQLFALPTNSVTATEDFYSMDIGPIHFVSLSTQYTGSTELPAMAAWLDADLAASDRPFTIVFFHKSIYSRGNHHTGEESDGALNQALVPVLDRHDVDLVVSGHSHDYERYAPSRGLDSEFGGSGRTFPVGDGSAVAGLLAIPDGDTAATYLVTGGAGAFTAPTPDVSCLGCRPIPIPGVCDCPTLETDIDGTVLFDGRHNYLVVEVEGSTLRARVWATRAGNLSGGEDIDAFTIEDATWDPSICGTVVPAPDAGTPLLDGGITPRQDSGTSRIDAGRQRDAGGTGPSTAGGCGCRAGGRGAPASVPFLLVIAAALVARRRSRR